MTARQSRQEVQSRELARLLEQLTVERYRPVPPRPSPTHRITSATPFKGQKDELGDTQGGRRA